MAERLAQWADRLPVNRCCRLAERFGILVLRLLHWYSHRVHGCEGIYGSGPSFEIIFCYCPQAIYGGQLAIPAVVDMLAKFRDSAARREQQIFSCMVHNLFDEYQFFTKYPDKVWPHFVAQGPVTVMPRFVTGGYPLCPM